MPKYKVTYDCTISFMSTEEMKHQLKALAYAWGMSGELSKAVRDILDNTIPGIVAEMNPQQLEKYNQVLENLKITDDFITQIAEDEVQDG